MARLSPCKFPAYPFLAIIFGNWYIRSSDDGILKPQNDGGFLWDDRSLRWLTAGSTQPELKRNQRALRFRLSSTFCQRPKAVRYSYRLSGFDETWSDWTPETQKDYTNLPYGYYRLKYVQKTSTTTEVRQLCSPSPFLCTGTSAVQQWYFILWLGWRLLPDVRWPTPTTGSENCSVKKSISKKWCANVRRR